MTSLIEARAISKAYDDRPVVEHVNLVILPKQIITLIGPNGCGKTTLLRLLLGLETPDSGVIVRKPGLRVGYMPQKFHVEATLPITVEWFLQLYAGKQQGAIVGLVEELGIAHLLKNPVQLLSGGEYQRVMLARALLCAPELLVLDEPVQGVDINGQAALYALITRISRERGIAVLMVSHDLHLVMSSTDEVICLNHHVCCAGHPTAVQNDPAFRDLFGAHVAASLAVYHHHHDHTHA